MNPAQGGDVWVPAVYHSFFPVDIYSSVSPVLLSNPGLLAKNKGASFMSEEAMALREARKKKKEDAASRKIPIKLTMWPKEARELWYKERLAELAEENRNRPKYTYSKEFVDSYLPSVPGMQSGKRRKSDRAAAAMKKADLEMERASRREFCKFQEGSSGCCMCMNWSGIFGIAW